MRASLLLVAAALGVALAGPVFEDAERSLPLTPRASDPNFRLPKTVFPVRYDIAIVPHFPEDGSEPMHFDAEVGIHLTTPFNNVSSITLHANMLGLKEVKLLANHSIEINQTNIMVDEKYNFWKFNLNGTLRNTDVYYLHIIYNGTFQNDMSGFYKSSYQEGNVTKWLATTQFQPVHARKAFPCFDEPEFKAVFRLYMYCPKNMTCISNMEEARWINDTVQFEDTPVMSTYLLAFIVSEFEAESSPQQPAFSVWGRPGAKGQGRYALDVGVKLVKNMENYTAVDYYDLNGTISMKMDQAAIPDFSAGAMENWGLLTYREAYLMIDDDHSTTGYKLRVANILAHEIAHMWFGDLVTCHWWSDTWLNEGFARYFQYYLTHSVDAGFELDKQFITAQVHTALAIDAVIASPPLTNENVNSPAEISDHFGSITYNKGAAVIRMIEHWMGSKAFKIGLHIHLNRKRFEVVHPEDLFSALQEGLNGTQLQKDIKTVFMSWTAKSGFPVLHVEMDHNDHSLKVKQERYLQSGETPSRDLYEIPITYATAKDPNFENTTAKILMSGETETIQYGDHDWVIFNVQQIGYYRVMYSDEMYGYLIKFLANKDNVEKVHAFNRAQLVDDAFVFARDGKIKFQQMFDIVQFLENDVDYAPWSAAYAGVNVLRPRFMHFANLSADFDFHILKLMDTVTKNVGLTVGNADNHLKKMFRTSTMNLACALGHKECIEESKKQFDMWINDNNYRIHPDVREFVYCNALRYGNGTHFEKLWMKYMTENVVNEKYIILGALGCTNDPASIQTYLSNTLVDDKMVKSQDKMTAFNSALTGNKDNVESVFEFFVRHVPFFRTRYGSNVNSIINSLAMRMNEEQLGMFEMFSVPGNTTFNEGEKTRVNSSIANARKTIEWTRNNEKGISEWIYNKYNSAGSLLASFTLVIVMLVGAFWNQ